MTLTQKILIVIGISILTLIHFEFTKVRHVETMEEQVIHEVKRFYSMECTQGRESNDPYVKCKDVLRFIQKYEDRHDFKGS